MPPSIPMRRTPAPFVVGPSWAIAGRNGKAIARRKGEGDGCRVKWHPSPCVSEREGSVPAGRLGVAPRAARRAVAALDVPEAPEHLRRGVGLPVGAGRAHLAA